MSRSARRISETSFCYIVCRGSAKQIIFEDVDDRAFFMDRTVSLLNEHKASLICWCLMDNHIHFVVKADQLRCLQRNLHSLCTGYAINFNHKNGHRGPVFQDRFASFPIEDDAFLMEAIRYVHLNCRDLGIDDPLEYPWCSYKLYAQKSHTPAMDEVIDIFGGFESFKRFHFMDVDLGVDLSPVNRKRLTDADARKVASARFGDDFSETIPLMESQDKERSIRILFSIGLSTRQIERMTGIGRSVIRRSCNLK